MRNDFLTIDKTLHYHDGWFITCSLGGMHGMVLTFDENGETFMDCWMLSQVIEEISAGVSHHQLKPGVSMAEMRDSTGKMMEHVMELFDRENPDHRHELVHREFECLGEDVAQEIGHLLDGALAVVNGDFCIKISDSIARQAVAKFGAKHPPVLTLLRDVKNGLGERDFMSPLSGQMDVVKQIQHVRKLRTGLDKISEAVAVTFVGEYFDTSEKEGHESQGTLYVDKWGIVMFVVTPPEGESRMGEVDDSTLVGELSSLLKGE